MTLSTWDYYQNDEQQQQQLDRTPKLPADYKHNSIRAMKIAISDDDEPPTADKDKVSAVVKRYDGDGRGTLEMDVKMYSKIEKKKPASSSLKTDDVLYGSGIKEGIAKPGKPIPVPGKDVQKSRLSLAPPTGAGSKLPTQVSSKRSLGGFISDAFSAILPGKPKNANTIVIDEERAREMEFCCLVSSVSVGHPQFISDVRPLDIPCRTNDEVELIVRRDWTFELNVRSGVSLLAGNLTDPPFVRLDKLHEKPVAVVCFTVVNDNSLKARSEMRDQLICPTDFVVKFSALIMYEGKVYDVLNVLSRIAAEGKMEVKDFLMPRTRSVRDNSAQATAASNSNKRRASENDDDGVKIQEKKVKSYTTSNPSFFYPTRSTRSSSGGRRSSVAVDMTGEEKLNEKSHPEDPPHEPFRYLFRYPFDAHTNVITLTTEDSYRLNLGQFLNDSVIDFYLRYFYEERLPQETKDRSYVFNCFFYKRLVGTNKEAKAAPKERYERVKSWTKKVNLFEKDFIVIPMHESAHWYLVIICYPKRLLDLAKRAKEMEMEQEVTEIVEIKEDEPSSKDASQATDSMKDDDFEDVFDFSTNEDKRKPNKPEVDGDSGADDPIKPTARRLTTRSNAFNAEESPGRTREKKQDRKFKEDIQESEKPFIFVMDSLGNGRPGALRHLKEYLVEEFKNTYPNLPCDSSFIKGHSCKLPTQPNHCDCGVYVMHYVEMFLQSPDQIFEQLSVRQSMTDWFSSEDITTKRGEVKSLMETLEKRYIEKKGDLNKQQESCVADDDDIQIVG